NLLRNFSALPGCTVRYVVDPSAERRRFVESNFPFSRAIETHQTVLDDPSIDGVVIATPAASHFPLAKEVLDAGKHVFVEKPLPTISASFNIGWATQSRSPLAARAWLTCRKGSTTLFSLISNILARSSQTFTSVG